MSFRLLFTEEAHAQLHALASPALQKRYKAVRKALGYLQVNPRHPGLQTHKYISLNGPGGEELFEAYAENRTPGAYRIFWYYRPSQSEITVVSIIPHP